MPIYTPNGLKIRIEPEIAFTYMGRLRERYKPVDVLNMVEGMEVVPSLVTAVVALVCFSLQLGPVALLAAITATSIIASLIGADLACMLGPRFLLWASKYVRETLIFIALAVYGYFSVGLEAVLYAAAGLVLGGVVNFFIGNLKTRRAYKMTGLILTKSERHFLAVFMLCAYKTGASHDMAVTEEEKKYGNWYVDYTLYGLAFPGANKSGTPGEDAPPQL